MLWKQADSDIKALLLGFVQVWEEALGSEDRLKPGLLQLWNRQRAGVEPVTVKKLTVDWKEPSVVKRWAPLRRQRTNAVVSRLPTQILMSETVFESKFKKQKIPLALI